MIGCATTVTLPTWEGADSDGDTLRLPVSSGWLYRRFGSGEMVFVPHPPVPTYTPVAPLPPAIPGYWGDTPATCNMRVGQYGNSK